MRRPRRNAWLTSAGTSWHGPLHLCGRTPRPALLLAALLVGLTLTSLLLFAAIGPAGPQALAAPLDTPTTSPAPSTATPQPTQAAQATLVLTSPSSGVGPVGASLTFSGSHWSGSQVTIAAAPLSSATPAVGCANLAGTLGQTTPRGDGSFTVTLTWPSSLAASGTEYLLCATAGSSPPVVAAKTYRVRSSSPPALTLSLVQAAVGQEVQVQGSNFVGASQVFLKIQAPSTTRALPTASPDPKDGSFVATYTPPSGDVGTVTITATSAPDASAPPALQASVSLTVGPPLPATATATGVAPETTAPGIITITDSSTDALAPSVLLAVGLLLALLAFAGLVAWLRLRSRPARRTSPGAPPGSGSTPGSLPGVWTGPRSGVTAGAARETARVPVGVGARSTSRVQAAASGRPAAAPIAGSPDASSPPAGWRRRPMSGKLWSYADDGYRDAVMDAHEGGYRGNQANRPWSGTPAGNAPYAPDGFAGDDGEPTQPGSYGYFGLPSLETLDDAATQPGGPALPEAHE